MMHARWRQAGFRLWAALSFGAVLITGGAVAIGGRNGAAPLPARAEADRPTLLLLTSLPLVFSESFTLDAGSPALTALERRYRVEPISVADAASLKGRKLLLMAHPLAQPAEALVELDAWVRAGGRLVLLADPKLDWPSRRPLGDRLRPPPGFADTGLLGHWGLKLYAPENLGPVERKVDGRTVQFSSPGILGSACGLRRDGLLARCDIGRGKATVIADADFIRADSADSGNLQFLLAELGRIERRDSRRVGLPHGYPQGSSAGTGEEHPHELRSKSRSFPRTDHEIPCSGMKIHCIPTSLELPTKAVARG